MAQDNSTRSGKTEKNHPKRDRHTYPERQNFRRSGGYDPVLQRDQDFRCVNCQMQVSGDSHISGVRNRNHCPYCLYSQHVDLQKAGDRLADCHAAMKPIGLTVKQTRKKYGTAMGELMLVHICQGCGKISINRIAADDLSYKVLDLVEGSRDLDEQTLHRLQESGIHILQPSDRNIVQRQLGIIPGSSQPEA